MPASEILVLQPDPKEGARIASALEAAGRGVTVSGDLATLGDAAEGVRLVVLDGGRTPGATAEACRRIRADPVFAGVPVLCVSRSGDLEERITLVEAGADDVIVAPYDARELQARADALLLRSRRRTSQVEEAPTELRSRRTIACFGPKGGSGTTSLAVNVGAIAAETQALQVVAVDLRLQFGALAAHFNVKGERTLADLIADPEALEDPELFRTYARPYRDRLWILASPDIPGRDREVDGPAVERLLRAAHAAADVVIVDAGSTLDARTMVALDQADSIIVPVTPDIASIAAVRSMLESLRAQARSTGKLLIVLNHLFAGAAPDPAAISKAIGAAIALELPYDRQLYLASVNEGTPLALRAPSSPPAAQLRALTWKALGLEPARATEGRRRRRIGALLRRA